MDSIREYVRTALNGVRQRFNKLEKDFDKKLDDKLGRDELPPPQPQIQSDWNESNEESVAYVCNRPFYDDIVVKTYTYKNVGTSGQGALTMDDDFEGNFILGETYTVTVNGTTTDIVATTDHNGNYTLFHNSSTDYRIFVSYGKLRAFTWWNSGSTVSITGPIHVLKQIDNKFLNVVSSLNGETGDVVINADKLGAASSISKNYLIHGKTGVYTPITRNWLGLGSDSLTGLVLGNIIAYDDIEDDLSIAHFTFIPDLEKQAHSDNEDVVIRGVADPTALNDATSKSYVDKAINGINSRFASVDKKLNNTIHAPATAIVGQTIAVKSVDENGKPVEWETADFSTSGGSGCVVNDTAPEDTSVLWIDTSDNSVEEVPGGSVGGNIDLGVTGATVGQTVKIAAVDENGVPTAWESVDFPSGRGSGGGENYRLVIDYTVPEDQTNLLRLTITEDVDGHPFNLRKAVLFIEAVGVLNADTNKYDGGTSCVVSTDKDVSGVFWGSGKEIIRIMGLSSGVSEQKYLAIFEVVGGLTLPITDMISPNANYVEKFMASSVQNNTEYGFRAKNASKYTKIDQLSFASYATLFKPGTRVRMWGVDT